MSIVAVLLLHIAGDALVLGMNLSSFWCGVALFGKLVFTIGVLHMTQDDKDPPDLS